MHKYLFSLPIIVLPEILTCEWIVVPSPISTFFEMISNISNISAKFIQKENLESLKCVFVKQFRDILQIAIISHVLTFLEKYYRIWIQMFAI